MVVALAVAVFLAAGVASGVAGAVLGARAGDGRTAAATVVEPAADGGTFATAAVVQAAMTRGGLPCPVAAAAESDVSACVDAAGPRWVVKTYTTVDAQIAAMAAVGRVADPGFGVLVYGRNWVVLFRDAVDGQAAVRVLGGQFVLLGVS